MRRGSLRGKTALVTGGAGFLGRHHAAALAGAGARVVLSDREAGGLRRAAAWLKERGAAVRTLPMDIARPASVAAAFRSLARSGGGLDVLVNNAQARPEGVYKPSAEFSFADWEAVCRVNLGGVFLCCQRAHALMRRAGRGSIVNIASIYGVVSPRGDIYEGLGTRSPAVYSATKAGVLGLTRHLAVEWAGDGVRVNALTPGGIANGQDPRFVARYSANAPLGRMGRAEELGGALVYLAGEESSYVTGQNLIVDGGWTAW